MKRRILLLLAFVLAVSPIYAYSKEFQAKKKSGDWEIEIRIDRDPPILGDNNLKIEIRDAGGKRLTDAKVLVNYYMPPMPRMAPMNYSTDARRKGDQFHTTLRFIMAGPWYVVVIVQRGENRSSVKFNLQVP